MSILNAYTQTDRMYVLSCTHINTLTYVRMYVCTHACICSALCNSIVSKSHFCPSYLPIHTTHPERNCFYVYALIVSATVLLAALLLVSALVAGLMCAIRHARRSNTPQSGKNGMQYK